MEGMREPVFRAGIHAHDTSQTILQHAAATANISFGTWVTRPLLINRRRIVEHVTAGRHGKGEEER